MYFCFNFINNLFYFNQKIDFNQKIEEKNSDLEFTDSEGKMDFSIKSQFVTIYSKYHCFIVKVIILMILQEK